MPPIQKKRATIVTRAAAKRAAEAAAPKPLKPLTDFELFPRLPIEIRLKIWKIATTACDGRVIQVNVKNLLTKYSEHPRGVLYNSSTPIPGVLHACSESREMALHRYQLAMTTFASGPQIYVDFSSDTIYFGEAITRKCHFTLSMLLKDLHDNDISKIRHLGMAQELWNSHPYCNIHVCVDFPSLERITLTMERPAVGNSAAFAPVKGYEDHYTSFAPMGIMDDEDDVMEWPGEVEHILVEHLLEAYEKHDVLDKLPKLEFKMLCDMSKLRSRKASAKGKGK